MLMEEEEEEDDGLYVVEKRGGTCLESAYRAPLAYRLESLVV